jgi:methylenetetrahydrofolate dehydrogenase (NADP+)/methenyltetrahydrofolate cyclohydrolase/formyltetrahydrofolate synthetase
MAALKIDGTAVAKRIREGLHAEILERQKTNPKYKPSLKIVQGVSRTVISPTADMEPFY